jgi:hypothetical protein
MLWKIDSGLRFISAVLTSVGRGREPEPNMDTDMEFSLSRERVGGLIEFRGV